MLRRRFRRQGILGALRCRESLPPLVLLDCFLRLLWFRGRARLLGRRRDEFLVFGRKVALDIDVTQRLRCISTCIFYFHRQGLVRGRIYLAHLRHVLGLVVQLFDNSIEPGRDLPSHRQQRPFNLPLERFKKNEQV